MRYARNKGLGKRCEVVAWIPPQRLIEISDERTDGMLTYYLFAGSKPEHLRTLVRSAYMQGVNDTVDASAKMLIVQPNPEAWLEKPR